MTEPTEWPTRTTARGGLDGGVARGEVRCRLEQGQRVPSGPSEAEMLIGSFCLFEDIFPEFSN